MDIFIRWANDSQGFKLPVNPESYTVDGKQTNTSVYINDFGEINLRGKRGLKTLSWSCFFPNQAYDFCQTTPMAPMDYVTSLEQCLADNAQMHVTIGTRVNLLVTLESFSWGEDDQSGDIPYNITFKEFRDVGAIGDSTRTSKDVGEQIYKWKKGDSWAKVCKALLGDSSSNYANQARNQAIIQEAKKKSKKKKEAAALVGYKVVISP